ncbi:MAG: O-antigen ligase family protein [Crocinitomicaceae bacterium]
MIAAYKEHIQFIWILVFMYIMGVWLEPTIYIIFPVVLLMFGMKRRYFELVVVTIWILILSDYRPVENATYQDLQFAKDLKILAPLTLFGVFLLNYEDFKPYPKILVYFIPFFVIISIGLTKSHELSAAIQRTFSYLLMYAMIPVYIKKLHIDWGQFFWTSLFTYIIGMLSIGVLLGFAIPDIGILEGSDRFKGIFGNPNGAGFFSAIVFILWLILEEFQLIKLSSKERWYTLIILTTSVIWCGSRNSLLTVIIFYVALRLIKINWFVAVIGIMSFVIFSEYIFYFLVEVISFFGLGDFFRIDTLEEGSGRYVAWSFAWSEIVRNYFFIGGGFGAGEYYMHINYAKLSLLGHQGGIHNSYLSFWFDSGLLGLIAFFGALLRLLLKSMKQNYIALAFAAALFFNLSYESWLIASLNPFTIMFLIVLTIIVENFRVTEEINYLEFTEGFQNIKSELRC